MLSHFSIRQFLILPKTNFAVKSNTRVDQIFLTYEGNEVVAVFALVGQSAAFPPLQFQTNLDCSILRASFLQKKKKVVICAHRRGHGEAFPTH